MKEKRSLWCPLVMMLFVSMAMVDMSIGQNSTRLYVDPEEIEGINPCCDPFDVRICIEDVKDLYAYGFALDYAPYVSVLVPILVTEGPFLTQGGPTFFVYTINSFEGKIEIACTLLPPVEQGVSGSGTLMTVTFKVVEAGESNLKLVDTGLINSGYEFIVHDVDHSYFKGPRVEILNVDYENTVEVTEKQTFNATVKKRSEACQHEPNEPPLWAFVRFDMTRMEDGSTITLTTDTCRIVEGTPYIFDPVEWYPEAEDVGTYACTAEVCFSYYGARFNLGRTVMGFMFTVVP